MTDQVQDELSLSFQCPRCGGGVINIENQDDPASAVTCSNCGVGFDQTWGEIREAAKRRALEEVVKRLRE